MARGQIWQKFPKLLRFMALFPSLHILIPDGTTVAAIWLRMLRMRILTRPEDSLANFGRQISNKKLRIKRCEEIRKRMRMVLRTKRQKIVLAAEIPCEWTVAAKFASDCECDGLVHSATHDGPLIRHSKTSLLGCLIPCLRSGPPATGLRKPKSPKVSRRVLGTVAGGPDLNSMPVPDNGNEWRKFRVVPRSHPLRPLVFYLVYCGVQNYSVSGFIIFELFTVIFFQDWAGWGIFTVIPGNPWRTKGDSQHLEARPELQDWLRSELFTVKNSRTGPFSNYLGNNFELYSNSSGNRRPFRLPAESGDHFHCEVEPSPSNISVSTRVLKMWRS